tara:strand:- start:795 stop:1205 length:411 start_codon:yes stop_codon:yes gene_type:complete
MRRIQLWLSLFLVFTVLSSGLGSAWQNVALHQQVDYFKNERLDLICTGDELRWIDPVASIAQGSFVFVEPPEDAPQQLQHPDCGLTHLADNVAVFDLPTRVALAFLDITISPSSWKFSASQVRFHQPPTRAPPLSS